MGHVTNPDQGLSSKIGKSLGTRLVIHWLGALDHTLYGCYKFVTSEFPEARIGEIVKFGTLF
jgi:hypothetical protein